MKRAGASIFGGCGGGGGAAAAVVVGGKRALALSRAIFITTSPRASFFCAGAAASPSGVENFFETYAFIFRTLPRFTAETIGDGQYTGDWAIVSTRVRNAANWRCTQCGVDCSNNRGVLHVHHRDGNRDNNASRNLQVLCIVCHSEQPMHHHMRVTQAQRNIISRLRQALD